MRSPLGLLLLFLIINLSCDSSQELRLKNASIVNPKNGKIEKVNIIIKEGKIEEITSDSLNSSNTIDLKGSLIISPLWDMHAHLHDNPEKKIDNFKDYGVFGVRDMGIFKKDSSSYLEQTRNYLNDEHKIFRVGYIYNGSTCEVEEHVSIDSRSDLVEVIQMMESANLKFFKIHNCFPITLLEDLFELCSKNEIKVVGHVPAGVSPLKFTEYPISSIEHIDSFIRGLFAQEHPVSSFAEAIEILDGPYLDSIADNLKRNNTYITPTLVTYENFEKSFLKEQQKPGREILRKWKNNTRRLWKVAVKILAGSDYPLVELESGK